MATRVRVSKKKNVESEPVQVEVPVPVEVVETVVETETETVVETVRQQLDAQIRLEEESKRRCVDRLSQLKALVRAYEVEQRKGRKRVKRVVDPSKPVVRNGIAKPQVISEDLQTFLFKYFKVPKGTLVSRTGALSKENGISRYINDKGLRRDGEIHGDAEIVKLLGPPADECKSDPSKKVYKHKSLMKLIGRHFPSKKTT